MELEDQVTNLELSKRLKELGVKQESLFYWAFSVTSDQYEIYKDKNYAWDGHSKHYPYSAFTVAELGEMLPKDYYSFKLRQPNNSWWCLFWDKERECEICGGWDDKHFDDTISLTEADARAKMLVYLIENNLVPHPKKEEENE